MFFLFLFESDFLMSVCLFCGVFHVDMCVFVLRLEEQVPCVCVSLEVSLKL